MTMTLYPPQRGFCIVALAAPVLLLHFASQRQPSYFNQKWGISAILKDVD